MNNHNNVILTTLKKNYPDTEFELIGSGCQFTIRAIGTVFENKSRLERQRMLNVLLHDLIQSGEIHAVQYKIYTPIEWANMKG